VTASLTRYKSWNDSCIELAGFPSYFNTAEYPIVNGDLLSFGVRTSASGSWSYCNCVLVGTGQTTQCGANTGSHSSSTCSMNYQNVSLFSVSAVSADAGVNITVNGGGFGSFDFPLPYTGLTALFSLADISRSWVQGCTVGTSPIQALTVLEWTSSSITVKVPVSFNFAKFPLVNGDQLSVGVRLTASSVWTYCNCIVVGRGRPTTCTASRTTTTCTFSTSNLQLFTVSPIGLQQNQTIVISGNGFGSFGVSLPFYGNSPLFQMINRDRGWTAGSPFNGITLRYQSWNATNIVLSGKAAIHSYELSLFFF
jgi:hypothetical protein